MTASTRPAKLDKEADLAPEGFDTQARRQEMESFLKQEAVTAFAETDVVRNIEDGLVSVAQANGMGGLNSNTLLMGWPAGPRGLERVLRSLRAFSQLGKSLILGRIDSSSLTVVPEDREIHVWWGGLQRNGDLMLLLAYLLSRNAEWRGAQLVVTSLASSELMRQKPNRVAYPPENRPALSGDNQGATCSRRRRHDRRSFSVPSQIVMGVASASPLTRGRSPSLRPNVEQGLKGCNVTASTRPAKLDKEADLAPEGFDTQARRQEMESFLKQEAVTAFAETDVVRNIEDGLVSVAQANGMGGLNSNTLLMGWPAGPRGLERVLRSLRAFSQLGKSLILGRIDSSSLTVVPEDREIHVWWGGLQRNGDLMLLLAYLLSRNAEWRGAQLVVTSLASSELMRQKTQSHLDELLPELRINARTDVLMKPDDMTVREMIFAQSRNADVTFLGLPVPAAGREMEAAQRMASLAEGLSTVFFVNNSSPFGGELVERSSGST